MDGPCSFGLGLIFNVSGFINLDCDLDVMNHDNSLSALAR